MGFRSSAAAPSLAEPAWPAGDEALLDRWQRAAFAYFPEQLNRDNGLVAATSRDNAPISGDKPRAPDAVHRQLGTLVGRTFSMDPAASSFAVSTTRPLQFHSAMPHVPMALTNL